MFIWKDTKLRAPDYPQYTPYVDSEGTQYGSIPLYLLEEIPNPIPPIEAVNNPEWYFTNTQSDFPYMTWERKSDVMIEEMRVSKINSQIKSIETETLLPRLVRDSLLYLAEKEATQVAASMSTPENPVTKEMVLASNYGYNKAKEIDNQIIVLRSQL